MDTKDFKEYSLPASGHIREYEVSVLLNEKVFMSARSGFVA